MLILFAWYSTAAALLCCCCCALLLWTLAEFQNVIKVNQHKLANLTPEHTVHGSLESCWCIGQTKAEHSELSTAMRGVTLVLMILAY